MGFHSPRTKTGTQWEREGMYTPARMFVVIQPPVASVASPKHTACTWSLHDPSKMGSLPKIKGSWTHIFRGSWRLQVQWLCSWDYLDANQPLAKPFVAQSRTVRAFGSFEFPGFCGRLREKKDEPIIFQSTPRTTVRPCSVWPWFPWFSLTSGLMTCTRQWSGKVSCAWDCFTKQPSTSHVGSFGFPKSCPLLTWHLTESSLQEQIDLPTLQQVLCWRERG